MNKNTILLLAALIVGIFSACYEEKDWLTENGEFTGRAFPAVFMNTLDSATFSKGGSVRVYLEFFSADPIKEIVLYNTIGTGTRTAVSTTPYKPAFSKIKRQDTLIINYPVPTTAASATTIRLDAEVFNQTGVSKGTFTAPTSFRNFRVK